jgi:hypothetical protein
MQASTETRSARNSPAGDVSSTADDRSNLRDEERGPLPPQEITRFSSNGDSSSHGSEDLQHLHHAPADGFVKRKASQILEALSVHSRGDETVPLSPLLIELVDAYARSAIANDIRAETEANELAANSTATPDVALETRVLRGRKRASLWTQFRILSGRAFKNLYRDPALLAFHYLASIALACEHPALSHWQHHAANW